MVYSVTLAPYVFVRAASRYVFHIRKRGRSSPPLPPAPASGTSGAGTARAARAARSAAAARRRP
eukprot:13902509-Heterocapsa_arctica.AAC.1